MNIFSEFPSISGLDKSNKSSIVLICFSKGFNI